MLKMKMFAVLALSILLISTPTLAENVDSASSSHAFWVGSTSTRDLGDDSDSNIFNGFGDVGFLNYSPLTNNRFSPLVGVNFGDQKGFNVGVGYTFVDMVKPYVGVSSFNPTDFFGGETDIAAFAGAQFALPFNFGVDVRVTSDFNDFSDVVLPSLGIGYRF